MTKNQSPTWIKAWFLISSLLVLWDAGYCLLRPHSMEGGKWNILWRPYNLYGKVDTFYGIEAIQENDGFTGAQATMNLVETALNLLYLWMASSNSQKPGRTSLVGFSAVILTIAKTILYWLVEFFSGMRHTGHNAAFDYIFLWIIPNGAWIVFPSIIAYVLGGDLISRLDSADSNNKKSN
ncbi:hypothetical protein BDB00DRAFT_818574 [Zychaea mexicana]|uniref:uncharacterized protein n=1 Tax=Zychaea mexicana TaxID=64656 RepID=UPI0022FDC9D8|nr:uncharacterized protein BDB00DRAFT_818574 [Zychaea mexicana]KAI9494567.1 hypothetical protein BDB00DRAFT_818574 [Zychaea mexicana]